MKENVSSEEYHKPTEVLAKLRTAVMERLRSQDPLWSCALDEPPPSVSPVAVRMAESAATEGEIAFHDREAGVHANGICPAIASDGKAVLAADSSTGGKESNAYKRIRSWGGFSMGISRISIKSLLRSVAHPFYSPLWRRVWSKIDTHVRVKMDEVQTRIGQVQAQLDGAQAQLHEAQAQLVQMQTRVDKVHDAAGGTEKRVQAIGEAWRHHAPAFLQAVSSVDALRQDFEGLRREMRASWEAVDKNHKEFASVWDAKTRTDEELSGLWRRLDVLRAEMMYEIRYGAKSKRPQSDGEKIEPEVVSAEKLAAARAGVLRLNLGCGHIPLEGFINVDCRRLPGVDIVAEVDSLPVKPGEAAEIFSTHLLEHFPEEEMKRTLLPYWYTLLAPGGIFRAVVPDGQAMIAAAASSEYPFEHFRRVFFGAQDYDGDFHYNMFTPDSLCAMLRDAGFTDIQVLAQGRRNDICFEFEVTSRRPLSEKSRRP